MINKIRDIVNDHQHPQGRVFAFTMQAFILIALVCFTIETLPNLSATTKDALRAVEIFTLIIFTLEYLLRVACARLKWKFIFSFYGLIDLAAILPFYLALGFDLRAVRAVRFIRLFSLFKLFRYNTALHRLLRAFNLVKEELLLFSSLVMMMLFFAAIGIYYFENPAQPEQFSSIPHSLWWALITLTTVGYGDMYPITVGGKIFTFFVLITGLAILAVPTALVASALTQVHTEELEKQDLASPESVENER